MFQYFSDVHLEQYKSADRAKFEDEIKPMAPYLVLAGDIGDPFSKEYTEFLTMLSPKYKYIFLIGGNHEYYNDVMVMDEVHTQIKRIPLYNVIYLNNEVFHIPYTDITVFGGTFWTHINPEEEAYVQLSIMDYRRIKGFTIEKSRQLHIQAKKTLKEALDALPDKKFVVVSHHLPSYSLINKKYLGNPLNSAYASDIEEAEHPSIKAWVAGHTHTPIQQGKFYVNPIGYPRENVDKDFNRTFTVI